MKQMVVSPEIEQIMNEVRSIVSPVYLIGGSVRDALMGRTPHDYDFATPLVPDEIEARVRQAGKRPFTTGKRFGTIGLNKVQGMMVEVTTFRTEQYTPGSRKPAVAFVGDITHDLSRRDFTINAIALREDGRMVDPFGGREDIKNKRIRTVGKAYDRFNEDPLRMLRAARFAAQLDFEIDEEIEIQATKKASKILEISKERWVQELDKLLVSINSAKGLEMLASTTLLNFMLPELAVQVGFDQNSPYHELDLWEHTLETVCLAPDDLVLRWVALLHDIGKPYVRVKNKRGYSNYTHHDEVGAEMVQKIGDYLKWPKARTKEVVELVRNHLALDSPLHEADSAARFYK